MKGQPRCSGMKKMRKTQTDTEKKDEGRQRKKKKY